MPVNMDVPSSTLNKCYACLICQEISLNKYCSFNVVLFTLSPIGLLHFVTHRSLCSCATNVDFVPCLPSSFNISCHRLCFLSIFYLASDFFYLHASFLKTWQNHLSHFFLSMVVVVSSSLLVSSLLVLPLAHLAILISVVLGFCVYRFSCLFSMQTRISFLA